jgi:hypothetical protein
VRRRRRSASAREDVAQQCISVSQVCDRRDPEQGDRISRRSTPNS